MTKQIKTIKEAEAALLPYVPLVKQLTGRDTTLERITPLMKLLGNPQDKIKTVHVAGTSGKTSTSYYVAALLKGAGKTVGLTVSPHVDSITERVQLNGQQLDEERFCALLTEFLEIVEQADMRPSYFELLFAFAIWTFAREGVDYAVVETGLGGLHDATNVITRPDKVCVITDIGYDHMNVLGTTLESIAGQKIGIVHEGNTVFCYEQAPEVMQVFRAWTAEHEATLVTTDEALERINYSRDLELQPAFQRRNWLLAYRVYRHLQLRDHLPPLDSQHLSASQQTHVPGRMDIVEHDGKTLVMDGAHNGQKMAVFVASFRDRFPDERPAVLLALKQGKEYHEVVPLLAGLASRIIITTFATSQDLPVQAINPNELAVAFQGAGAAVEVLPDRLEAFTALMNSPARIGIVTGSFYLLGQVRAEQGLT